MDRKQPQKPTQKSARNIRQSALFIETAREIGADEPSSAADVLMGRLAKMPPAPKPPRQSFAERNPAQAMLEDAEFMEFKRFEAQAKGAPTLGPAPVVEGRLEGPIRPLAHDE